MIVFAQASAEATQQQTEVKYEYFIDQTIPIMDDAIRSSLAGYLLLNSAQSAPMRFDYGSSNGQIQSVYIAESNLVFKVGASGRLEGIWQFSSHSQAQRFLDQSRLRYFHSLRLPLRQTKGLVLIRRVSIRAAKSTDKTLATTGLHTIKTTRLL